MAAGVRDPRRVGIHNSPCCDWRDKFPDNMEKALSLSPPQGHRASRQRMPR